MAFTQRPGSGHPRLTSRREDCHIIRNACVQPTASSTTIQAQVAPSLGGPVSSQTIRSSDDNCVRVWRLCGEHLNPAFALQRHTTPTAGVMVWGAIAYYVIRGTMTAHRYVHNILQPRVLPFFTKTMPGLTQQGCHKTVTTLPWPVRSPDLSPIEHICDHLAGRVGHPMILKEPGKVTANMEQNASRHHTELVYLNARLYRIGLEGVQ
ncbi:transposable element Tcb2 transposase [Trichonephila clavipes]|nr:transposable element Tcb2 transposase [Trichonephila clavipes]